MPEYLSPGVYIEETSFRGKPIEGVSTSTCGLVGRAKKGPTNRSVLVTSFADFTRTYGTPFEAPDPAELGTYLGHAVLAFFNNGGKRAYIVRVLSTGIGGATPSDTTLSQGTIYNLRQSVRAGDLDIPLNTLRGISNGTILEVFTRPSPNGTFSSIGSITADSYNPLQRSVTLTAALAAPFTKLDPGNTFLVSSTPSTSGPVFTALNLGAAGQGIALQVRPTDLPPIALLNPPFADATNTLLSVSSTAPFYTGAIVEVDDGAEKTANVVTATDPIAKTITLATAIAAAVTPTSVRILEFDLLVFEDGTLRETFPHLTWNSDPNTDSFSRYFVKRVNDPDSGSRLVTVADPAPGNTPDTQPTTPDGFPLSLTPGSDGSAPTSIDFIGQDNGPGNRTGIQALIEREGISLIAAPGITDEDVQGALITQCELLKYRFAVLDGKVNISDVSSIQSHRNNYDSKYAAYYAPWLEALDLSTGHTLPIPPSGAVLGIYARSDTERGVHKAPANEVVRGISALEFQFSTGEQDVLNPEGVNLIREFTGRGIRLWGARTISSDPEWKYVNVRRLFIFLEHSIDIGTQWVVFEPNNEALWARVVESITPFLIGVWKTGALMGSKPEEAFFVRCDRSTMTQDDIDNGRLVCLIGVAPTKPAEFVIFRIGQFTAQTSA